MSLPFVFRPWSLHFTRTGSSVQQFHWSRPALGWRERLIVSRSILLGSYRWLTVRFGRGRGRGRSLFARGREWANIYRRADRSMKTTYARRSFIYSSNSDFKRKKSSNSTTLSHAIGNLYYPLGTPPRTG